MVLVPITQALVNMRVVWRRRSDKAKYVVATVRNGDNPERPILLMPYGFEGERVSATVAEMSAGWEPLSPGARPCRLCGSAVLITSKSKPVAHGCKRRQAERMEELKQERRRALDRMRSAKKSGKPARIEMARLLLAEAEAAVEYCQAPPGREPKPPKYRRMQRLVGMAANADGTTGRPQR